MSFSLLSKQSGDQRISAGKPFNFSIAPDTFADPFGNGFSYTAASVDGSPLPSWISFDPVKLTFSGTAALST